ncbi:AraC family transcriptional regulator [Rhizobium sp. BK251]|uniref:helix-turn-helix domain-containing protein n=1 Tax=Rhizobium sp. BK251 TaxID=2512125 RepID=UPI00104AE5CE|nr:AraC family transcriptional regulator [Rhizobium sp. BK251]TCL62714.1 AraC family transcriptional regulator [Rhizobium sp. BK251]
MEKHVESPDRFEGIEPPSSLQLSHLVTSGGIFGRLKWREDVGGVPVQMEQAHGYMVCYQREYLPVRQEWVDGRPLANAPVAPGQFMLLDLRRQYMAVSPVTVDCVSLFASHDALVDFSYEHDLSPFSGLRVALGATYTDPIMRHLMECLVPAFEAPEATSRLFLDQLMLTLLTHMTAVYGDHTREIRPTKGGLAPWQERRIKELLLTSLHGDIGLDLLSKETGLSRAHLARSFKASTGKSPMMWLLQQRLCMARNMLVNSNLTLSQIAHDCGFTDHSHFSRVFSKHFHASPGKWRRKQRL